MSKGQSGQTLADYVAIAISPALIMALVVSLVFFLVEVVLGPKYPGQLLWILFFFVFGSVLVARISMSGDIADKASLYGLILAVLGWIALRVYVKYPDESRLADFEWLIDALLIAIIWWSTYRLTWDSTLIDDKQDASGAGLLQVAGLDSVPATAEPAKEAETATKGKKRKGEPGGLDGWIQRYQKYRAEASQRPHAPGVWVVWFSLAALPLFGLGQSLIPPADGVRRRYVFWLMGIYVGSGLGLLLTTSFLNLRRYLRQRSLQMPMAMTGAWLTGGVVIIALLLTLGAMIPRPNAEYPLVDVNAFLGIKEREGSRQVRDKEGARKEGEGKGQEGDREGEGDAERQGDKGAGDAADAKGADPKDGDRKGKGQQGDGQPPPISTPNPLQALGLDLLLFLKWILGVLVALVIAFLLLRALLRFLANFTGWASGLLKSWQSFWDRLRGWWTNRLPEASLDEPEPSAPPPPFSTFRDPFLSGEANRMSPAELVRHAFDALEAWAWERGLQRQPGETPLEFADRLGMDFPALEKAGLELANLYAGLAYARKVPPPGRVEALRRFWRLLGQLAERPMSAGV